MPAPLPSATVTPVKPKPSIVTSLSTTMAPLPLAGLHRCRRGSRGPRSDFRVILWVTSKKVVGVGACLDQDSVPIRGCGHGGGDRAIIAGPFQLSALP